MTLCSKIRAAAMAATSLSFVAVAAPSHAAIISTLNTSTPIGQSAFVLTPDRGEITTVSASQQGGGWHDTETNSVSLVASGTTATPTFALTLTNNTGGPITSVSLSGSRIQFKDNSSNLNETLTASLTGAPGAVTSGLNIAALANTADTLSTINTPPLTGAYSASITGLSVPNGGSFTITWTDANDGGTDAQFGVSNLSVTAAPEPASLALLGVAGGAALLRRGRRRA